MEEIHGELLLHGFSPELKRSLLTIREHHYQCLLNAPEVHNRYSANFLGAILAEIVLFRLGQFDFSFDPVFQTAPVFPKLDAEILKVVD